MEWLHIASYPIVLGLLISSFFVAKYQGRKEKAYKNDERWKDIVAKSMRIMRKYFQISLSVSALLVLFLFRLEVEISLWPVFLLLIVLELTGSVIEFFTLRYYDKRM